MHLLKPDFLAGSKDCSVPLLRLLQCLHLQRRVKTSQKTASLATQLAGIVAVRVAVTQVVQTTANLALTAREAKVVALGVVVAVEMSAQIATPEATDLQRLVNAWMLMAKPCRWILPMQRLHNPTSMAIRPHCKTAYVNPGKIAAHGPTVNAPSAVAVAVVLIARILNAVANGPPSAVRAGTKLAMTVAPRRCRLKRERAVKAETRAARVETKVVVKAAAMAVASADLTEMRTPQTTRMTTAHRKMRPKPRAGIKPTRQPPTVRPIAMATTDKPVRHAPATVTDVNAVPAMTVVTVVTEVTALTALSAKTPHHVMDSKL